ncbi:MAG: hypothetical protein AAGC93_16360 [Cyanobacteria bacterium P01_F01_bin.53]
MQKICTARLKESTAARFAKIPIDFLHNTVAGRVLLLAQKKRYSATAIANTVNADLALKGEDKLGAVRVGRICSIDSDKVVAALTKQFHHYLKQKTAAAITTIRSLSRDVCPKQPFLQGTRIDAIICPPPPPCIGIAGLYQNHVPRFARSGRAAAMKLSQTKPIQAQSGQVIAPERPYVRHLPVGMAVANLRWPGTAVMHMPYPIAERRPPQQGIMTNQQWQISRQVSEVALYGGGQNNPFVDIEPITAAHVATSKRWRAA